LIPSNTGGTDHFQESAVGNFILGALWIAVSVVFEQATMSAAKRAKGRFGKLFKRKKKK